MRSHTDWESKWTKAILAELRGRDDDMDMDDKNDAFFCRTNMKVLVADL